MLCDINAVLLWVTCFVLYLSDFLLVGDASGAVSVLSVGDLSVVLVHKLGAPGAALSPMASPPAVQCVVMAEGDKHMLVACELSPLMVRALYVFLHKLAILVYVNVLQVVTDPILVSKPQPK